MKGKIVIYTCVTGGYDRLSEPACLDGRFDFVSFVKPGCAGRENEADASGRENTWADCRENTVWRQRELPWDDDNPTRLSRRAKHNPAELLGDYEYSVWMDGNIDIIGPEFYESIIAAVEGGTVYGMLKHPFSDDSYDEALRCLAGERIDLGTALRAVSNLKKHGVARNEGLMESNVLLRKHNEPEVLAMGNCWWSKMTRIAMRDQLTLQCALHETGLKPDLLWNGRSTRDFPAVRYRGHNRFWVKDRSLRGRLRYLRLEIGKLILRLRIWWM